MGHPITNIAAHLDKKSIPEPNTGCRLWLGKPNQAGYGLVAYKGRTRRAHRVAYEVFVGPIPEGMFVCHHCDNPCCIEPTHLFVGTNSDNMRDMVAKGRNFHVTRPERVARGDRTGSRLYPERRPRGDNHYSRLHPERLACGERHGSRTHPECVLRGDASPARLHPETRPRGEAHGMAKLTTEQVIEIRRLYSLGQTARAIAEDLGINRGTVKDICGGRSWRHLIPTQAK